jgi:hypothetical protein
LLTGEANVYKQIAIALKPGAWRRAGLATVLIKMGEGGGERQPVNVLELMAPPQDASPPLPEDLEASVTIALAPSVASSAQDDPAEEKPPARTG